jgi:hypothetical protein
MCIFCFAQSRSHVTPTFGETQIKLYQQIKQHILGLQYYIRGGMQNVKERKLTAHLRVLLDAKREDKIHIYEGSNKGTYPQKENIIFSLESTFCFLNELDNL